MELDRHLHRYDRVTDVMVCRDCGDVWKHTEGHQPLPEYADTTTGPKCPWCGCDDFIRYFERRDDDEMIEGESLSAFLCIECRRTPFVYL